MIDSRDGPRNDSQVNYTNAFIIDQPDKDQLLFLEINFEINATFATCSLLFNFTVVLLFCRMQKQHQKVIPNVCLLFQSFSDIVVAAYLACYTYDISHPFDDAPEYVDNIFTFFYGYSQFLSINVLIVASLERFVSVRFPFIRQRYVTRSRVVIAMVITFIVSAVPVIVYLLHIDNDESRGRMKGFLIVVTTILLSGVVVVDVLLILTYCTIKRSIRRRIEHRESYRSENPDHLKAIKREEKRDVRLFKLFIGMCTLYAVTFIPYVTLNIYMDTADMVQGYDSDVALVLGGAFELLYASSSIINPLMTIFMNIDYRKTLLGLFRCCSQRESSTDSTPRSSQGTSILLTSA